MDGNENGAVPWCWGPRRFRVDGVASVPGSRAVGVPELVDQATGFGLGQILHPALAGLLQGERVQFVSTDAPAPANSLDGAELPRRHPIVGLRGSFTGTSRPVALGRTPVHFERDPEERCAFLERIACGCLEIVGD